MHKVILLLIGFLAAAYAQCSGNGVLVGSDCACYSGNSGSDCSSFDAGSCSFQTALPLNTTIVAEFANGAVLNDFFTFSVLSEAYNQRYFDDISLAGNSSCSYPGSSFFTHSFLGLPDCMDSYNANFSIPDVVGCGFTTDAISVPGQFLIQGSIHVSAIDSLGQFRSAQLNRNTRSVLNVEITIPTSVFVNTTTPLTVFSTINPTYAITSQEYDATTDTMTIVLTSSVQWPYQLVSPVISGAFLPDSSSISDNSNGCSQLSGNCFQDTTLTWSPVANRGPCDISGAYTFTWNFDCRSGQSPCPVDGSGTETATAQIQASDVCAKVTVVANIGGSLHSYPDNTFNTPQLVFVAGQTLYFLASLTSDVSINVISMDILTVTQQNQSPQTLVSSGIPNDGQYIGLNYGTDPTGNPDEFGFHFDAFAGPSSEFIFDTSVPDSVFTFTVEATFNIQYKTTFGRKRDTVTESLTFTHRGVLDTSMKANNVHAGLNSDGTNSGYKVAATVVPFAFAAAGVVANNL